MALKAAVSIGECIILDNSSVTRHYLPAMIKTFRDKDTEQIFSRQFSLRFSPNLHRSAWKKLAMIDAAEHLDDLRVPPGNRLEKLTGNREDQSSIRINDQWRVCFGGLKETLTMLKSRIIIRRLLWLRNLLLFIPARYC